MTIQSGNQQPQCTPSWTLILLVTLVLTPLFQLSHAECTLNSRFIGRDSGVVVPVAIRYDLTVSADTKRRAVLTSIVPAVEREMAKQGAARLIKACAPTGTDTSNYSKILGIDLDPPDSIVGQCASKKPKCFTIHSEATIYVKNSAKGIDNTYLMAMHTILSAKTTANVDSAIVSITNIDTTVAEKTSPQATKAPGAGAGAGAKDASSNPIQEKIDALRKENPGAFIGIMVGVGVLALMILLAVGYAIYYCCNSQQGGGKAAPPKKK